ncbi:MAG: hypothetical protein U1E65_25975 [Myxococcota bacterium]
MKHLDAPTWTAFLARTLPPDAQAALRAHLEESCETCEDFLAAMHQEAETDGLDGLTDDALLGLAEPAAVPDDLGFQRVLQAMEAKPKPKARPWLWAAPLIAAGLAVALIRPPSPEHLKGDGAPLELRLEVLRSEGAGKVVPLASGARLRRGEIVVFRVRLSGEACLRLYRGEGAARVALDEAPRCLAAGEHVLSAGGEALGLKAETVGPLVLVLEADRPAAKAEVRLLVEEAPPSP